MTGGQLASWIGLSQLAAKTNKNWTLIGGQLIQLHCWERNVSPSRVTDDIDAVLDVIMQPEILLSTTKILKDLGFTPENRAENVRRVAEIARLMVDAGLIVIVALVSPFEVDRQVARALFDEDLFNVVWVNTSAEVCAERDPKGLYKKAKSGDLPNLTGVGQEYEPPVNPELVIDGTEDVTANVAAVLRLLS